MAILQGNPSATWLDFMPCDWVADRLKDIVSQIVGGGTPASSEIENWEDGDIVWVTPTDFSKAVGKTEVIDSERKITLAGLSSSAATLLPKGAVIMSSRATIGTVKIAGTDLATNQGFISFVCDESKLHNRFLYFVIVGFLGDYFTEIAPGTTFCEISRGKAKQEPVSFPLFPEQERIATYLDARCKMLDAALEAKRLQLETLEALRKDVIQKVVTRGLDEQPELRKTGDFWMEEVPVGWDLICLKRVSELQGGLTLGKTYDGPLVERPYLRVANVQDGHLDLDDVTMIEVPVEVAKRVELRVDDVLMTEGGDLDKLARGYLWKGEIPDCLHQNHIFAVRCFHHKLLPKFLTYLTASRYGRDYFEATGKKTTNLASTNATKVGAFPLPLPPVKEQARLVEYLEEQLENLRTLQNNLQGQISTLLAYRKSLIHECVTGQRRITELDLLRLSK